MSAVIIDGKALAEDFRRRIKADAEKLHAERGIVPGLTVVLVGDDPASAVYVRGKERACADVGFKSNVIRLGADTQQSELIGIIERLNRDELVHGILVQLPLPKGLDEMAVIAAIDPKKDVDCFCMQNAGALFVGGDGFLPCTPHAVMELIHTVKDDIYGLEAVVVGRSNIVGKPTAMLLLRENATVTLCHSRTRDLGEVTRRADILVAAVGRRNTITRDMVKPGAIVIDVGMNRKDDGKLCGDCDFDGIKEIAGAITPVPKGVGPMTIAMLMENTLRAALNA